MGAYLSEPITNKETSLEENDELRVASSSMQGWRVSQEDAHNAIINFDNKTSLFAVYDGHGGHEVAEYTAKKLPAFIKMNKDYQKGNIKKALVDSFVEFDHTIVKRDVVAELKRIAGKPEDDIEDEEEVDNLYQEATMPIEEVIAKYEANEIVDADIQNKESPSKDSTDAKPIVLKNPLIATLASSSGSKGVSPYLRAKATSIDKNGESDFSSAKEIDFMKEDTKAELVNGSANKDMLSSEKLTDEESNKNKVKKETNGEHKVVNSNTQNNSEINELHKGENPVVAGDKQNLSDKLSDETKQEDSAQSNGDVNSSTNDKSNPEFSNGTHGDKKNEVNEESSIESNKGKGKGKGKGKSSIISTKTSNDVDSIQETKPTLKVKRAPKSAAELYRNVLIDDEQVDDEILDDESDEDVVYKDDSDSDEGEEDQDEDEAEEEEDDQEESEEEEDVDEDNGEGFIGGEFNEEPGNDSGCTAVVALLRGNELFVANAGDSRCVVCRDGKAIEMSFDHKPEDTPERERIESAGGRVTPDGRVNGGLNLSRAIGDHAYKTNKNLPLQEQMISPEPDIRTLLLDPTKDSYIVLACDGIWNSLTSQEVVDFVSERLDKLVSTDKGSDDPTTQQLQIICEELFEHCLAPDTMNDGTGMDNMTTVIVKLRPAFDGNKSAKNLLAIEGSSAAIKLSSENTDSISSNGDAKKSVSVKRTKETNNEESSASKLPCSKKVKLDEEKKNEATSDPSASLATSA